jgi:hypothetical protein
MVFSTRPVYKLQYRVRGPIRRNRRVVFSGHEIQRLDVDRFSLVDLWETYAPPIFATHNLIFSDLRSGVREKHPLVRFLAVIASDRNL